MNVIFTASIYDKGLDRAKLEIRYLRSRPVKDTMITGKRGEYIPASKLEGLVEGLSLRGILTVIGRQEHASLQ